MPEWPKTTLPTPALAVVVPTIGRPSLGVCLSALASQTQPGDHVIVSCDSPRRYDWCQAVVEGLRRGGVQGRWRVWSRDGLGHFGHVARNEAIDFLASLEDAPAWCWSLDDDDSPTPDALALIRDAIASNRAPWFAFRMVGGGDSHFPGVTIPNRGEHVLAGNIGTPMLVFPTAAESRFGLDEMDNPGSQGPGYFGDLSMALALRSEFGDPCWIDAVVAEVRPSAVVAARLAT